MSELISTVRLIDLSALEVHQLYKLRVDIFVHEQQIPYAEIDDTDADKDTWHVIATHAGVIVGTARIFPEGDALRFGRFALGPDMRGTGMGSRVFDTAMAKAHELAPEKDVILDAQVPVVPYYAARGFEVDGAEYLDTGVPHQPMRKKASAASN